MLLADGNRFLFGDAAGLVRVCSLVDGRVLGTVQVLSSGGYLAWTADGFFDGSVEALGLFRVPTPAGLVPASEATAQRSPEKVRAVFSPRRGK